MEQTPTFQCLKNYEHLNAKKGDVIKMSPNSLVELDEDNRFIGWRDNFKELSLDDELLLIKN